MRMVFWRKRSETERQQDELVARTLAAGRVPDDAPPELRALLEETLRAQEELRAAGLHLRGEALAARERGRARFRAAMTRGAGAEARVRPGYPRLLGGLAAAAAAVAALLVALVMLTPGEQTASAEPLRPGDVVELEGVLVSDEQGLAVASPLGTYPLEVPPEAAVADAAGRPLEAPAAGAQAVVLARVDENRRLVATALAVGARGEELPRPIPLERLARLDRPLRATIVSVAVQPNGESARLIVRTTEQDRLLLVEAPLALLRPLLGRTEGLAGLEVEVRPLRGEGAAGVTIVPVGQRAARTALVAVQGRVERLLDGGFVLSTPRGPLTVRLAPEGVLVTGDRAVPFREVELESLQGERVTAAGVVQVSDGAQRIATRVVLAGED